MWFRLAQQCYKGMPKYIYWVVKSQSCFCLQIFPIKELLATDL